MRSFKCTRAVSAGRTRLDPVMLAAMSADESEIGDLVRCLAMGIMMRASVWSRLLPHEISCRHPIHLPSRQLAALHGQKEIGCAMIDCPSGAPHDLEAASRREPIG